MAGTSATQATQATGVQPPSASAKIGRGFQPSSGNLPPLAPLRRSDDQPAVPPLDFGEDPNEYHGTITKAKYDYRAELIKQLVALRKMEADWRSGIMDEWSTERLAFAGLQAKMVSALINGEVGLNMSEAEKQKAKATALAGLREYTEKSAATVYLQPDQQAIKAVNGASDDINQTILTRIADDDKGLDEVYNRAMLKGTPEEQRAAKLQELNSYLSDKTEAKRYLDSVKTHMSTVADGDKYDTAIELRNKRLAAINQALGSDPRFADVLPDYLASTANSFLGAAGIDQDVIAAGEEKHRRAEADDQRYWDEYKTGFGGGAQFSKKAIQMLDEAHETFRAAAQGDPAALNDMVAAIAVPEEMSITEAFLERELQRQDTGDTSKLARDAAIAAFNARAGRNDAFLVWANAMGFRGKGAIDRAANYAAAYPDQALRFIDAAKADPNVLDVTAGYQGAKDAIKAAGDPVGARGIYKLLHRPTTPTPVKALEMNPELPGADTVPKYGGVPPRIEAAPVTPPVSTPALPEAPTPAEPMAAPYSPPTPTTTGAVSTTAIEHAPDGSLVAVRSDGSRLILEPAPVAAAPRTLDLGEEAIIASTPEEEASQPFLQARDDMMSSGLIGPEKPVASPTAAILGQRLGPAVMPSDIPATAASDMRNLIIRQRLLGLQPEPLTPQPTL